MSYTEYRHIAAVSPFIQMYFFTDITLYDTDTHFGAFHLEPVLDYQTYIGTSTSCNSHSQIAFFKTDILAKNHVPSTFLHQPIDSPEYGHYLRREPCFDVTQQGTTS